MRDYITTYSKVKFEILNPREEDIRIEDIAHALSMLVRANGHFSEFFSVAQHCIQCAKEAMARNYVPRLCMACLLHDASEAYLSDVTRPVKKNMVMYLQIEEQLQNAIYRKFIEGEPVGEEAELLKGIDDACLYYEFKHFMDIQIFKMEPIMLSDLSYEVRPMKEVEQEFLEIFEILEKRMREEQ